MLANTVYELVFGLRGRYHVDTEDAIIEMREIIVEVNRKYDGTEQLAVMKMGEIFQTGTLPVIST